MSEKGKKNKKDRRKERGRYIGIGGG